jgi:hypothetical protein
LELFIIFLLNLVPLIVGGHGLVRWSSGPSGAVVVVQVRPSRHDLIMNGRRVGSVTAVTLTCPCDSHHVSDGNMTRWRSMPFPDLLLSSAPR